MSNSAACRELGINRRTGTRWRYGRKEVDQTGRERTLPTDHRAARHRRHLLALPVGKGAARHR
ncbi:hypothetical protein AB0L53_46375 [Nonomuraea sp. NPDC052129]|uniref:hypothetical protein n=1 Tax=Nonomuraea sp. NPDC052129 TaxID=3154651 RepID=UPI00344953BA